MTQAELLKLVDNQARARSRQLHEYAFAPWSRALKVRATVEQVASVERDSVLERGGITFTLPLPPSVNRYFKSRAMKGPNGKWIAQVYKSAEAKAYAKRVEGECFRLGLNPWPKTQMLRFSGLVVMERAGCDLDDRLKVLFDSLQGHVYENDEQVAEFGSVRRLVDSKAPRVEATFEPIAVDRYGRAS